MNRNPVSCGLALGLLWASLASAAAPPDMTIFREFACPRTAISCDLTCRGDAGTIGAFSGVTAAEVRLDPANPMSRSITVRQERVTQTVAGEGLSCAMGGLIASGRIRYE